jgi:tetratricopeptide (TPR) repeat protein
LRADALNGCGTLAHGSGDLPGGRRFVEEALTLYRVARHQRGIGLALNNLAWLETEAGEFRAARVLAEEASALHRATGDKRGLAVALNNLAWIANYIADFEAAAEYHGRSIALRREAGDHRGVAFGLANLAWTEQRRGAYDHALALADEALRVLGEVNDEMLRAWARQIKAAAQCDLGDYRAAIAGIRPCLPVWQRVGNTAGLAFAAAYLALAALQSGDLALAQSTIEEGESALLGAPQRWGAALLELVRSRLEAARGRRDEALRRARQAVASFEAIGDRLELAGASEWLAELEADERPSVAREALDRAEALRVEIGGTPVTPCFRGAVARVSAAVHRHGASHRTAP